MYILEPIIIEKPWGVTPHLIKWISGITVSGGNLVGELWIASGLKSLKDKANKISNAPAGTTIVDIAAKDPQGFLGTVPIPFGKSCGKTEAWYVRDVKGDVRTITGLKEGIGKKEFLKLIKEGYFDEVHSFEELENEVFTTMRFERGAFYVMLPGTLHTIYAPGRGSHIVIDEIQQGFGDNALPILSKILFVSNSELSVQVHPSDSDVTNEKRGNILKQYETEPTVRVYDFGRGRNAQPELAAELIRYDREGLIRTVPVTVTHAKGCKRTFLGATKHFIRELMELRRACSLTVRDTGHRHFILHCIDGDGTLLHGGEEVHFERGMTISVSAWVDAFVLKTKNGCLMYRDYLPDLERVRKTLRDGGASEKDIQGVIVDVD